MRGGWLLGPGGGGAEGLDLGNLNVDPVGDGIDDIGIELADVGIDERRGDCDVREGCPCAILGLCGGEGPESGAWILVLIPRSRSLSLVLAAIPETLELLSALEGVKCAANLEDNVEVGGETVSGGRREGTV